MQKRIQTRSSAKQISRSKCPLYRHIIFSQFIGGLDTTQTAQPTIVNTTEGSMHFEEKHDIHLPFISPYSGHSTEVTSYDAHRFYRCTCIVMPNGEVIFIPNQVEEVVLVHKNWTNYCTTKGPVSGFLGKGLFKCAFNVRCSCSLFCVYFPNLLLIPFRAILQ